MEEGLSKTPAQTSYASSTIMSVNSLEKPALPKNQELAIKDMELDEALSAESGAGNTKVDPAEKPSHSTASHSLQEITNDAVKSIEANANQAEVPEKKTIDLPKQSDKDNPVSKTITILRKNETESQSNFIRASNEESQSQPTHQYYQAADPENFRLIVAGSEEQIHTVQTNKKKVELQAPDVGSKLYNIQGNIITPPLIPSRLPEAFDSLPVFQDGNEKEPNKTKMLRDFVGSDLNAEEFEKLGMYCSPDNLRSGDELIMPTKRPKTGFRALTAIKGHLSATAGAVCAGDQLQTIRKHRLIAQRDVHQLRRTRFKYRGVRFLDNTATPSEAEENPQPPLVPGKDILFRVRIYRPFTYSPRDRLYAGSSRHPVFVCDLLLLGRHTLSQLRDRIACVNDDGLRLDLAPRPDYRPETCCKELFPSGFLFINNVFYNDHRDKCSDYSKPIREWAERRKIGTFPTADMAKVRLDQMILRLGYPEVYVHQGNCEHLFTFSEVRLIGINESLDPALYPCHKTAASYNLVYCTTCAEFPANWVVTGSGRVPFDPALFCDTCLKLYMYRDGEMIGDFKAYSFKGNELETLTLS